MLGLNTSLEPEDFLERDEDGLVLPPDLHPETGQYIADIDQGVRKEKHDAWLDESFDQRNALGDPTDKYGGLFGPLSDDSDSASDTPPAVSTAPMTTPSAHQASVLESQSSVSPSVRWTDWQTTGTP